MRCPLAHRGSAQRRLSRTATQSDVTVADTSEGITRLTTEAPGNIMRHVRERSRALPSSIAPDDDGMP